MSKPMVVALALLVCLPGPAQAQAPAPASPPPAAPAVGAPLKITETGTVLVARLPADNPYGAAVDVPASAPVKTAIPKILMTDELYVAVRVDAKGKPTGFKRVRDPIPSLAAETQKSLSRWSFDPPKKGGQPVDTWTSLRLDLAFEVDPFKIEQLSLTPITRETPLPTPFEWPSSAAWLDSVKAPATTDAVPLEQLDLPPTPRKYPWSGDSFKRPIAVKLWVHVTSAGRLDRIVPIQLTDPFLIGYLKKGLAAIPFRPARSGGDAVDSWGELNLQGTIDASIELKQVVSLRKTIAAS